MFQINQNNQVLLSRGQAATYKRTVCRDDKYFSPYILPPAYNNMRIRLVIKATKNDKDPVLEYEGAIPADFPKFKTQVIQDVNDIPSTPEDGVLYRLYNNAENKYEYFYYVNGVVHNVYNFVVAIDIPSIDTIKLKPATYYYTLELIHRDDSGEIDFKDVWITPTEWMIGGSY